MQPTIRTRLGEFSRLTDTKISGIYVIACYPSLGVLYIGISNDVITRLLQHFNSDEPLSNFIKTNFSDSVGWRLDIFEINDREKQMYYERKLIQYFRPEFNKQHLGEQMERTQWRVEDWRNIKQMSLI